MNGACSCRENTTCALPPTRDRRKYPRAKPTCLSMLYKCHLMWRETTSLQGVGHGLAHNS